MLKKDKGITLISLIIYLIAMTLLVAVVANISKSFYLNMSQFSDTDEIELQMEKFNTFFLKQINTSSIDVENVEDTSIEFNDGTKYVYENNAIYYKTTDKNLKLCDNIDELKIIYDETNKTITVNMKDKTNVEKEILYKKR